ncbi:hypothetical protein UFOVP828_94 [uncultured Caudovirales phage]|uniref:Uncharacterized protein n=1 Tax=uncultured Caudovirales phage TaxID=2100421 RepID=A0A6J5PAY4_9CAUD|nr:hypothetical protein UFOVP828_94 [uncultured Caudovirales phage]
MTTPYNTKYAILSNLWTDYKDDKDMADFFEYNDLGLPLAFMIEQKIVESTPVAQVYIEETFELLVESLGLDSEEEYESIEEMFDIQAENEADDV